MIVLPQFGDQLSSLQLYLRMGGQVVGRRMLSDHSIGLDIQIPVNTANKANNLYIFLTNDAIQGALHTK